MDWLRYYESGLSYYSELNAQVLVTASRPDQYLPGPQEGCLTPGSEFHSRRVDGCLESHSRRVDGWTVHLLVLLIQCNKGRQLSFV